MCKLECFVQSYINSSEIPSSYVQFSYHNYNCNKEGSDSAVSTATCYRLDSLGIKSCQRQDFPHLSRLALGPTQPPIQWVLGLLSWGNVARVWHWPPILIWSQGSRKSRAIRLFPVWTFVTCLRVNFTFLTALFQLGSMHNYLCKVLGPQPCAFSIYFFW
jgi:hypothetical protein